MFIHTIWDLEDEPYGNIAHIAEHGLTVEEVEEVLDDPEFAEESRSSRSPAVYGYTSTGKYTIVIFELVNEDTVYPVTAYEVAEPK